MEKYVKRFDLLLIEKFLRRHKTVNHLIEDRITFMNDARFEIAKTASNRPIISSSKIAQLTLGTVERFVRCAKLLA